MVLYGGKRYGVVWCCMGVRGMVWCCMGVRGRYGVVCVWVGGGTSGQRGIIPPLLLLRVPSSVLLLSRHLNFCKLTVMLDIFLINHNHLLFVVIAIINIIIAITNIIYVATFSAHLPRRLDQNGWKILLRWDLCIDAQVPLKTMGSKKGRK